MIRTRSSLRALLFAASILPTSMSAQSSAPTAAGCYIARVGAWDRRVGESTRRGMPRALTLDSSVNGATNTGRVTMHFDSVQKHSSHRTPGWALNGNALTLVWGDKFSFTVVKLKRTARGWKGTAEERTDIIGLWPWRARPRASVELTRQPCA